jgi:hypothetical protein
MTSTKAYDIIQRRQINEDRILAERTSMFLLATSFLFAAFVVLLTSDSTGCIFKALGILLPSVGISLTLLLLRFNVSAVKALGRWHDAQCEIEGAAGAEVFKYMFDKKISPHYEDIIKKRNAKEPTSWLRKTILKAKSILPSRLSSTRAIYWLYLPLVFLALWVTSLVFVSICYF